MEWLYALKFGHIVDESIFREPKKAAAASGWESGVDFSGEKMEANLSVVGTVQRGYRGLAGYAGAVTWCIALPPHDGWTGNSAGSLRHNAIDDPALCATPEMRKIQRFAFVDNLPEWTLGRILGMWHINKVEFDHLGVFLARVLLRRKIQSAGAIKTE